MQIKGLFFDGKSSSKQSATLICDATGKLSFEGATGTSCAVEDVDISPRVGNTIRYIDFPDGSQFETNDNDSLDELQSNFKPNKLDNLIYKLEGARTFVLTSLVILVVGGWAFIQYGIPYLSREVAMKLPEETLVHLGQGMLDTLDEDFFKTSIVSYERQEELNKIFRQLKKNIGNKTATLEYRSSIIIGANALALPNGVVIITDQLLDIVSENEEIIAIILHELGHVENRHTLRSLIQSFGMTFFVMAISGDVSTASNLIASAPLIFIQAGYSQNMETEADTFSLDYMLSHNIDPLNFVTIMEKLQASHSFEFQSCMKKDDADTQNCLALAIKSAEDNKTSTNTISSYLSTHPSTDERIKRFKVSKKTIH